jgi:site-specific recombinase XerC
VPLQAAEESTARDRAIVALLLFTGLRLSEAAALHVGDVRISARKGSVVVRSGKGDAYREVELNALVRAMLDEWVSERAKIARDGETSFFVSRTGIALSSRSVDLAVRRVAARAARAVRARAASHVRTSSRPRRRSSRSQATPRTADAGRGRGRSALGDLVIESRGRVVVAWLQATHH